MNASNPTTACRIEATPDSLVVKLSNREFQVAWECCSQRLAQATHQERRQAKLSPGGYGIHWPLLDEDLSIGWLLQVANDK